MDSQTHYAQSRGRHEMVRAGIPRAGEVLVSNKVKELVVGSGIEFRERGAHRLKGSADEWSLFAVVPSSTAATRRS